MFNNSAPLQSDPTPAGAADAASYVQTNLVSDLAGLATVTDPNLVNPWGVSFNATISGFYNSPFWISNQGSNSTTVYAVTGSTGVSSELLKVGIPTTAMGPQGPTGQVANTNASSFILSDNAPASFIFANLNGTISAWDSGPTASVEVTTPGAIYTGLAINQAHTMLYAANDSAGTIDVFNSSFAPVNLGAQAFQTPSEIATQGLVPFNVTDIGGNVYVTYAPSGHTAQTMAGLCDGAVAIFTESGTLEQNGVLLGGADIPLAAPWGVAIAPNDFGQFSGDLLVGNFSYLHSEINAFDPQTLQFEGTIPISAGSGNTPGGLWDLTFGAGGSEGSPNTLYFTDGIDGETHGLFGAITSVPLLKALHDFNADGTSDVLLQSPLQSGGTVIDWLMQNGQYASGNLLGGGFWQVIGTGDFTGNGTSDVLLQSGGTVIDWIVLNGQYQSENVITTAATGWQVVGTGDFTGNGTSDVLVQSGGTVVDWIMNNGQYQSGNLITDAAAGWQVVGTGDFTGNGTSDVLLQNGGTVVDWIMQNGQYQSGNVITNAAAGWQVVGTGDFAGTGTSDVLVQSGGTVVDWIMQNGQYQSGNVITTAAAGWQVVGTGDYNGDGTSDVLVQSGGTVVDWIMKNGQYQSGNVITNAAAGWQVVGGHA
jgi:uncharacterized protein (TIGR03118 family)